MLLTYPGLSILRLCSVSILCRQDQGGGSHHWQLRSMIAFHPSGPVTTAIIAAAINATAIMHSDSNHSDGDHSDSDKCDSDHSDSDHSDSDHRESDSDSDMDSDDEEIPMMVPEDP
jgi:DNA-directed RNA polymerase delta subunit